MTDHAMPGAAAEQDERRRDAGLRQGIGTFAFAAATVNAVVGAGIFSAPGQMAASAGAWAWLAYLVCAVAVGTVILCFAEAGSRVPTSGGTYGYVAAAFGPLAGFVAGVLLWLGCVLASAGIADAFAGAIAPAPGAAHAAAILAVVVVMAAINLAGVGPATRLISWGTVIKLVPIVVVIGLAFGYATPARLGEAGAASGNGFGRAVLLALFAFQGAETAIAASGEVANPSRSIPRGLIGGMLLVTLLYVGVQLACQGLLGARLAGLKDPLAEAARSAVPALGAVLVVGASLSRAIWIGSDMLGAPRVLFAFARDGMLPAALGRVSARTGVPHVALAVHAAITVLLAVSGSFEQLAILSALATSALYAMGCAAAWRLRQRDVAVAGAPVRIPGLALLALLGIVLQLACIAFGQPAEIAGLVAAIIGAVAIYGAVRLARRR